MGEYNSIGERIIIITTTKIVAFDVSREERNKKTKNKCFKCHPEVKKTDGNKSKGRNL